MTMPVAARTWESARGAWAYVIPLLIFVAGRCLAPMDETDLFYNLRLGEIVLATHAVPTTNLLSFTYPDHPDPNLDPAPAPWVGGDQKLGKGHIDELVRDPGNLGQLLEQCLSGCRR